MKSFCVLPVVPCWREETLKRDLLLSDLSPERIHELAVLRREQHVYTSILDLEGYFIENHGLYTA